MSEAQLKPPSVASTGLSKEMARLEKENKDLKIRIRQSEKVMPYILALHGCRDILPPEDLRLRVGTNTSPANFYAQGASSARTVVDAFGADPGAAILDWGCGSGRTFNWLQTLPAWREHYVGCDVDPIAIEWLRHAGVGSVAVCTDDPPLPYPDGSFGGLFSFSVLTHIHPDNHDRWYAEIARVLRPGARALITVQGDVVVNSGNVKDPATLREFSEQGWAFRAHDGHYKSAALVSRGVTESKISKLFKIVSYQTGGYHNMDMIVAEKQ